MTYAVLADLVARFGETELVLLSDDDNTGSVNEPVIDQVLADVDSAINSYLTDRYQLPLAQVPAGLVPIACDLARYQLATRTGTSRSTETISDRNTAAVRWLEQVASGKIGLGLDASAQEVAQRGAKVIQGERVFTRRRLRDFTNPPRW